MRAPLELTARGVVAEPRPVARRPVCSTRPEFRPLVPARHGVYAESLDRFAMLVEPVMLPPGRLRLVTRPSKTGSLPNEKTTGITGTAFREAVIAARTAGVPNVMITPLHQFSRQIRQAPLAEFKKL